MPEKRRYIGLTSENLIGLVKKYGIPNVGFIVPMPPTHSFMGLISWTSSTAKMVPILCKIEERWNRRLDDNYKLILRSTKKGYSYEDFYVMDLVSMINQGYIKMVVRNG